jgi:hypothetical protein
MRRVISVGVSLAPMKSLVAALKNTGYRFKRIDLEAGPAVAMALQRSRRNTATGGPCRDAAHEVGAAGADRLRGSQRCTRHRAADRRRLARLAGPPK